MIYSRFRFPRSISLILLFLCLMSLCSCGKQTQVSSSGTETQAMESALADTDAASESPEVPVENFSVGDSFLDGDLRITCTGAGVDADAMDEDPPEEGYEYRVLRFVMENTSEDADANISFYNFEGYADDFSVDWYCGYDGGFSCVLSPGRVAEAKISFVVPSDSSVFEVDYPATDSSGTIFRFTYEGEADYNYASSMDICSHESALNPGESLDTDSVAIHYLSCDTYTDDSHMTEAAPGYHYVICRFSFENLTQQDAYISSLDFSCYADNIRCEQEFFAEDDLNLSLPSGRKGEGTVLFEVPDSAQCVELEYMADYDALDRIYCSGKE